MNKTDYIKKMKKILGDSTNFKLSSGQDPYEVSRRIERRVRTNLPNLLKKPGYISDEDYKRLYPNGFYIGVLYGLPKVHKTNVPTRPNCSAIETSTYELGKYLANIIKPAASSSLGTDVSNTFQFAKQICNEDLSSVYIVSFDVRSLFTNVPLKKIIKICLDRLYRGDPNHRPSIPESTLKKLLELCVCNNTFVFNGKVYEQIDGVAMGSSLGPLLANVHMAHLEEEFILKSSQPFNPTIYRRYVDDTFCLFREREHATKILEFINSIDPAIQFKMEDKVELDDRLSFLDTVIKRSSNNPYPEINTRIKPTDKGLFYNFSSFIPDSYKRNLVYYLVYRVY